jgi:hypothetical protein
VEEVCKSATLTILTTLSSKALKYQLSRALWFVFYCHEPIGVDPFFSRFNISVVTVRVVSQFSLCITITKPALINSLVIFASCLPFKNFVPLSVCLGSSFSLSVVSPHSGMEASHFIAS